MIRPATASDLTAVRALLAETWHATYDALLGRETVTDVTARWHAEEVLAAEIGRTSHCFLIAEVDGQVVATASATLNDGAELEIKRLYVLPHYQGRAIGKALYSAVLAAFPAARAAHLEVERNNTPAIRFYERLGFTAVSQGNACGGDTNAGIKHLVMRKAFQVPDAKAPAPTIF